MYPIVYLSVRGVRHRRRQGARALQPVAAQVEAEVVAREVGRHRGQSVGAEVAGKEQLDVTGIFGALNNSTRSSIYHQDSYVCLIDGFAL